MSLADALEQDAVAAADGANPRQPSPRSSSESSNGEEEDGKAGGCSGRGKPTAQKSRVPTPKTSSPRLPGKVSDRDPLDEEDVVSASKNFREPAVPERKRGRSKSSMDGQWQDSSSDVIQSFFGPYQKNPAPTNNPFPTIKPGPAPPGTDHTYQTYYPRNYGHGYNQRYYAYAPYGYNTAPQSRSYAIPLSIDPHDNERHLVETVPIQHQADHGLDMTMRLYETPGIDLAWTSNQQIFEKGDIQTKLLVINAAEGFTFDDDKSMVTLYCQKEALGGSDSRNPHQISWLHVQHRSKVTNIIKSLIRSCPLIDPSYRSLALGILNKALLHEAETQKYGAAARSIVLRSDGESLASSLDPKPVAFISTPYLVFQKKQPRNLGTETMQALLNSRHRLGNKSRMQVLSETQPWLEDEIIHVAQMRCLLIGQGVLLTWGELPSTAIRQNNIVIDDSDSRPLVTVKILHYNGQVKYSSVKHDMGFAELNARIESLFPSSSFEIFGDTSQDSKVYPELWVKLLNEASSRFGDIHLSLRDRLPMLDRTQRAGYPKVPHNPSNFNVANTDTIINDPSVLNKAREIFHLSSSENESEPPKKGREPSSTGQRKRPKSAESSKSSLGISRLIHEASSESEDLSCEDTGYTQSSGRAVAPCTARHEETRGKSNNFDKQTTPFLVWRVTQGHQDKDHGEGNIGTMMRLIDKVDMSLSTCVTSGLHYKKTYTCSMESLCSRYESLMETPLISATISSTNDVHGSTLASVSASMTTKGDRDDRVPLVSGQGSLSDVETIERANKLIHEIFTTSKELLGCFVPINETTAHTTVDKVLNKYWGALDASFRHLRFAARMHHSDGEQTWKIRKSYHLKGGDAPMPTCQSCQDEMEYSLVGALEHLHANIAPTQAHGAVAPEEDPCTVWLENIKIPQKNRRFNRLERTLDRFAGDLNQILHSAKELRHYAIRPKKRVRRMRISRKKEDSRNEKHDVNVNIANRQGKSYGKSEGVDGRHSPQSPTKNNTGSHDVLPETPALPVSLLSTFESIIALFTAQARVTKTVARKVDNPKPHERSPTFRAMADYEEACQEVESCFQRSREDLIKNTAAKNDQSVRLGEVGSEYIVAIILRNVQAGVFHLGAGSSQVPKEIVAASNGLSHKRGTGGTVMWAPALAHQGRAYGIPEVPDVTPSAQATLLNVVALYREHARALAVSASIDPQRRVFLAIRAFEEDLEAIQEIWEMQGHCLGNMIRVTDPMSFRVTNKERQARFPLEEKLLKRLGEDKTSESQNVRAMMEKLRDLRGTVVESIEVLDEGHTRAIRIFTLVTLFFLPLSFVTSFFGMNTADVRDMSATSRLYWSIAAPLTLLTIGLAYLYGYKWEAVARRVTRRTWLERGLVHDADGTAGGGRADTSWARRRYGALRGQRAATDRTGTGLTGEFYP